MPKTDTTGNVVAPSNETATLSPPTGKRWIWASASVLKGPEFQNSLLHYRPKMVKILDHRGSVEVKIQSWFLGYNGTYKYPDTGLLQVLEIDDVN